jgi:hypothetical protein
MEGELTGEEDLAGAGKKIADWRQTNDRID